jgi:glycosyltransferase involved in cell wall biosynthesis
MTSTYKLSEGDASVPFLVENVGHLVANGASVHVFAPSYEGLGSQVLDGVPVYRFRYFFKRWEHLTHKQGAPNRLRNPLYLLLAPFYILAGLLHAVWFCVKNRFDLIHVHWPFPHAIWGYVAGRLSHTPVVLTFHGAELLLTRKYPFVKYFLRHALRHAEAVTCNSRYTAGEVAKLSDKPVSIVPFGCTVQARPAVKRKDKPVKDILFVGRLIARKGLGYLLRALAAIDAQVPVHLHVVGDGDQAAAWKALANELRISDKVTFHGAVSKEQLERHYAQADVFVFPAIVDERGDTEGMGVVLVEALSFMTPVVASEVGGIADVIQDQQTGLLVPEKDPAALAAAVVRLLRDRGLADRLAEAGLRHAHEYFDWQRITSQLLGIYAGAMAAPAHSRHLAPNQRRSRVARGTRP